MRINLDDCISFAKESEFDNIVIKARQANELLKSRKGKGSDFLGWMDLPDKIQTKKYKILLLQQKKYRCSQMYLS